MQNNRYRKPESLKLLEKMAFEKYKHTHPNFPEYAIPPQQYSERSTNALTRAVIDFIELKGYQAERINSTGRQIKVKGKTKWIKGSSTNGTADISATIEGRAIKIEIKCKYTGDHYQSPDQKAYQKSIEKAGGIYILVRDYDSFYQWFKSFTSHG